MTDMAPDNMPPPDATPPGPGGPSAMTPQLGGPPVKRRIPRWIPLTLVIGFIAACAVTMLLILGFRYGVGPIVVGLVAAILPVPVLVACFLWLDRYEPEPARYLVFCFAWGSCVATLAALGVNTGASLLFERLGLPDALVAVLVAPFIEESMKALGPILLLWRRRREWSGITDGIVYCGLSAVGFAMVENVLYLGGHGYAAGADQYGPATGIQNVFLIFIVRILFTGFAHPLFTSMTGVGLGVSSRSGDRRVVWLAPIAGLLTAMILHGTFNLLPTLSVALRQPLIMLYGYLGFMVPFFFAAVGFAIALRGWEGRLTERILPYYVIAGWFSPPEVASLGSLGRRHSARRWAKRVAGAAGLRAMKGFQHASTELALLRDGMLRGLDRKPQDAERAGNDEWRLLNDIMGFRSVLVGRDPQAPRAFWTGRDYRIAFPDGQVRTVPPPPEPVVPVPVRLAPMPVAAYQSPYAYASPQRPALPGYGTPPNPAYGTPSSGYGTPNPGYGTPPSGYGAPGPGYGTPGPGYGAPTSGQDGEPTSGYGAGPSSGYGSYAVPRPPRPAAPYYPPPGDSAPHGYSASPGYRPPPEYPTSAGYGAPPGYPTSAGYGAPPGYPTSAGYGQPPEYPTSPGYGPPPGYPTSAGYRQPPGNQAPGSPGTPGYPSTGSPPGAQPSRGPDPDNAPGHRPWDQGMPPLGN